MSVLRTLGLKCKVGGTKSILGGLEVILQEKCNKPFLFYYYEFEINKS